MVYRENSLELRSLVTPDGTLELSLLPTVTPDPEADEVVVRVEGAPINPSDLGLLLGPADLSTCKLGGTLERPSMTATIPAGAMTMLTQRVGHSMPVGNEGAGRVVAAGSSAAAQALLGKMVAIIGGAMYSQFRVIKAADAMALPDDITAAEGASAFVNPLTALGMVETMRSEGHKALVHTAAASNLGQMLTRLCLEEGIGLVNIVRSKEQADLLRALGAPHVIQSNGPDFMTDLVAALAATGATLAFDAIGGGKLAGQILTAMEIAINQTAKDYSRYGSSVHKQVYLYGSLDPSPTEFTRAFGMAWGMGGWLLTPFLMKIGPAARQTLQARVVRDLRTTFASHYSREISLVEALQPEVIAAYGRRATGEKFLLNPNKGCLGDKDGSE
jgi:NADPH:quinone reductase-like Zn-dependent oxidoreductase